MEEPKGAISRNGETKRCGVSLRLFVGSRKGRVLDRISSEKCRDVKVKKQYIKRIS